VSVEVVPVGVLGGLPVFCFIWFPPPLFVGAIGLRVFRRLCRLLVGLGWLCR